MACKRSAVRSRYSPPKSTVLRWKYGAFLFAEVGFWGLHCFACTVFRLLQAVSIQPPTFDFTPFSKRNVCRPVFQQAAASSPSMYGVRSKLKVMLSGYPKKTPSLLIGISCRDVHISTRRCLNNEGQMPRNVKVNSTGLVTSGIYSGWTLAPQLSSPPTPICSPMARITV